MKKAIFSILLFSAMGAHSQAQSSVKGYRVGPDATGILKCYGPSHEDQSQTAIVDDIFCVSSYKAAPNVVGAGLECFAADAFGTVFGRPLTDAFCSASYRAATTLAGDSYCFNVDKAGKVYGRPVEDLYCQDTYTFVKTASGQKCFNVDENGKVYGKPVEDFYCD